METTYDLLEIKSNRYLEMRFAGLTNPEAVMYMALLDFHEDGNEWLTLREVLPRTKSYVSDPYHALRKMERKGIVFSTEVKPYMFSALSIDSIQFQKLTREHRKEKLEQMTETNLNKLLWDKGLR